MFSLCYRPCHLFSPQQGIKCAKIVPVITIVTRVPPSDFLNNNNNNTNNNNLTLLNLQTSVMHYGMMSLLSSQQFVPPCASNNPHPSKLLKYLDTSKILCTSCAFFLSWQDENRMNHARSGVVCRLHGECTNSAHSDCALSTLGHLLLYCSPLEHHVLYLQLCVFVTIQFTTFCAIQLTMLEFLKILLLLSDYPLPGYIS